MLKDLHELGVTLQTSYQTTFTQEDKELPVLFKQLVNNIEGSAVNYNRNSFVVTVNYSNQKIYFPNQLWYIAAYFADFYYGGRNQMYQERGWCLAGASGYDLVS